MENTNTVTPSASSAPKIAILAPHIDDELIGCYPVLKNFKHVPGASLTIFWFYETTKPRLFEGQFLINYFGANCCVSAFDLAETELKTGNYTEVYVPSRRDSHVHHRNVNCAFRGYATHFYSVDMVGSSPLTKDEQADKLYLLNSFYPSQKELWEGNAKYYLFDSIKPAPDFEEYQVCYGQRYSLTVLTKYLDKVLQWMHVLEKQLNEADAKAFDKIVSMCPEGDVIFKHRNGIQYVAKAGN